MPTAEKLLFRMDVKVGRKAGGASRDRTGDLKLAKLALSQLSYGPGSGQRNGAESEYPPDPPRASGGPGKI
jgi:hypothetical protein